jgi:hypothetical protein
LDQPILRENGNRNQPKDNPKGDKDSLGPTSKHPFAFKKGINAARREKGALFSKQATCSCLLPLPKNLPATAAHPAACTTFECWRRRVTNGKT